MTDRVIPYALGLVMFFHASSALAESTYSCPEKIGATWKIPDAPAGWEISSANEVVEHFLVSSTFSDGHPNEKAFLKPDIVRAKAVTHTDAKVAMYKFSGQSPDGIWLVCMYGNTPAMITKKLTASFKTCWVTLPRDTTEQSIRCQ